MRRGEFMRRIDAEFPPGGGRQAVRVLQVLQAVSTGPGGRNPPGFTPAEMALIIHTAAWADCDFPVHEAARRAIARPAEVEAIRQAMESGAALTLHKGERKGIESRIDIPAGLLRDLTAEPAEVEA